MERDGLYGRTSRERSVQMEVPTFGKFLELWQDGSLMCGSGRGEGLSQALGDLSNGVCLMHNTSESPNGGVVSMLSSILETGPVDSRYSLSAKAASGFLRRARERGRVIPEELGTAFMRITGTTAD